MPPFIGSGPVPRADTCYSGRRGGRAIAYSLSPDGNRKTGYSFVFRFHGGGCMIYRSRHHG